MNFLQCSRTIHDRNTDLVRDYRSFFSISFPPAVANQAWVHPEQSVVIDFVTRAICLWSLCKCKTRGGKAEQNICFTCSGDFCSDFSFRPDYQQTTWCNIIIFISASCVCPPTSTFTDINCMRERERKRGWGVCTLISESIKRQEKLNYNLEQMTSLWLLATVA